MLEVSAARPCSWRRAVYEDQGDSIVMMPGDRVLQTPGIRHRVLECAPQRALIEIEIEIAIACPAARRAEMNRRRDRVSHAIDRDDPDGFGDA